MYVLLLTKVVYMMVLILMILSLSIVDQYF